MTPSPDSVSPDNAGGQWLSVTALARLKGVTKQTISERVKKLVAQGLVELRPGKGREKLVEVAAYERAIGQVGDPAKQLALETKEHLEPQAHGGALLRREAAEPTDPGYRDAATREKLAKAQIAEIELEERLGRLVAIADVEDAMVGCAQTIIGALERLPLKSAEMVAAVGKDGEIGARRVIKAMTFELRTAIAAAMSRAAGGGERVEKSTNVFVTPEGAAADERERVAA